MSHSYSYTLFLKRHYGFLAVPIVENIIGKQYRQRNDYLLEYLDYRDADEKRPTAYKGGRHNEDAP